MPRLFLIATLAAFLALPILGWAEDTPIPPETRWTPYPPATPSVNAEELAQLLMQRGVITPREFAQLTQPEDRFQPPPGRDMSWRLDRDTYPHYNLR
jgi:hypothetical protein